MTRFFTSDTHFSHRNVISYCDRPYKDIEHMNSEMTRIWNKTVKPEDEIIELINDPRENIESRVTEFYNRSKPKVVEK